MARRRATSRSRYCPPAASGWRAASRRRSCPSCRTAVSPRRSWTRDACHASMLVYSLLHLAGFDVTMDDIKAFRQYGSRTPGHPEYRLTPGVEATTGPLGQGIANAVGMALSGKMMAARMNGGGSSFDPID